MTVGGAQATVVYRGLVTGSAGVGQVNFIVPAGTPPGVQPVIVTVGAASSPSVNITVVPKP